MTPIRTSLNATDSGQEAPDRWHQTELIYLYGIAPSSTIIPVPMASVGRLPRRVELIPFQRIAAITSEVSPGGPLGTPDDLRAHAKVLDAVSALAPVLPMQFGGVMADCQTVVGELLAPHHDEFASRLELLRGHDQFIVKGAYLGDIALRETLLAEPKTLRLRDKLRGTDPSEYRNDRLQLGELIARGLDRKRAADTALLVQMLAPHAAVVARPDRIARSSGVQASFLVHRTRTREFEAAAEELGKRWDGRIQVRLLGPLAPFDFASPLPMAS